MNIEAPARPDQTAQELEALMEEARRRARRRRFGYAAGAVALLLAIAGGILLDGDKNANEGGAEGGAAILPPARATTTTRCKTGVPPDHYVPKPAKSPIAVVGCARLGVSGKPVELSVSGERIGRKDYVCLNPSYRGRGNRGDGRPYFYIPSACTRDPVSTRLDVLGAEVPNQGVRGYQLAIWGTASPSTRKVHAEYEGKRIHAAVFPVTRSLAQAVGAMRPFSVFVLELPRATPCRWLVTGGGSSARFDPPQLEPCSAG